ncbi:MAG: methionyl-tRNA formyltransferase, partial [Bdellovibrionales bacterium]|nr:methionyl-tRNA formyltransferase [Bdellovibrionales bacterium]
MTSSRIIFFGTPDFAVPTLAALIDNPEFEVCAVVTQPDRPAGRGNKLTPSPVKQLALAHRLPVLQPERIKGTTSSFLEELGKLAPIDLAIVVAFGQILPTRVLEFPRAGSLNIHASLLPRWRGAAPIHHAILAGDTETGVCLMKMEAGLDTGPVYVQEALAIAYDDTLGTLHDKLAQMGAQLLIQNLPAILTGSIQAEPQANEGLCYAHKVTPA